MVQHVRLCVQKLAAIADATGAGVALEVSADEFGYRLLPHGRYCHSQPYLRRCLESSGFKVVDSRNEILSGVTETTVFFSDAPGEREAADEVGQLMQAPVEPRGPGLADQPPGIIVAVTG